MTEIVQPKPEPSAAGPSGRPLISLRDVHKSFGSVQVINGVSLDVARGQTICIIGPSGSGKSTLIRCINALVPINSGSIKVDGIEVNDPKLDKLALRRKVGIKAAIFGHKITKPNLDAVKQVYKKVEDRPERVELNLYVSGYEDDPEPVGAAAGAGAAAGSGEEPQSASSESETS